MRKGFTLIEVMVAVMIISVVIMALLQMFANNTHIFSSLKKQTKANQYASLLIANDKYGFQNDDVYIYDLVSDFDLENDLRRELKSIKAKIIYQELDTIELGGLNDEQETETSSNLVMEFGNTILKTESSSTALVRLKIR